jgi:hypothetical protein
MVAVLLTRSVDGTSVPKESSFVAIFIGGALTAALAMVLIALSGCGTAVPKPSRRAANPAP